MHGYRMRTFDLPSPPDRTRSLPPRPAGWDRVHATKIGGVASDVQSAWSPEVPADWRFLGEIAAVVPAVGVPFPVVDREAPLASHGAPEYRALTSGPGDGVTCLWLDGAGRVRVRFSCG
jgi:hypothetical protein